MSNHSGGRSAGHNRAGPTPCPGVESRNDPVNFLFAFSSTTFHAGHVLPALTSFYALWRVDRGIIQVLREDRDSPPERLLQAIWLHQRLLTDQLRTPGGLPVRVLHPGFPSSAGGPDFRRAFLQIGNEPPQSGDVEVDLRSSGWRDHHHDRNPEFKNVILHVTWEPDPPAPGTPTTLCIRPYLDSPLGELSLFFGNDPVGELPARWAGKCRSPLSELRAEGLDLLLRQAAQVRFQGKAALVHARARQVGWEQALWEGLFRALGYQHNAWPMQRLATLRPRWLGARADATAILSRLFGISGLLPRELPNSDPAARRYTRSIWDCWWRDRAEFSDCVLPAGIWQMGRTRPANHPQRRLALASAWSEASELPGELEDWCTRDGAGDSPAATLIQLLQRSPGDYWLWHCSLSSRKFAKSVPLLGGSRATDIAVNTVLPWLWARAAEGGNHALRGKIEDRYLAWPAGEDNAVLRLARQRLLGTSSKRAFRTAAAQQGLMQIVRDFCDCSNAVCDACRLPELARDFATARN